MADRGDTARLEFLGRLASIPDLDVLSPGEKIVLIEALAAAFPSVDGLKDGPWLNEMLRNLHLRLRVTIVPLLDGTPVDLRGPGRDDATHVFVLDDDGRLSPSGETKSEEGDPLALLQRQFVPGALLPWRKCRWDGRVFVRDGKRVYCSPACAHEAAQDARQEQKREYMREYARKRRAIKKTPSTSKKRKPRSV